MRQLVLCVALLLTGCFYQGTAVSVDEQQLRNDRDAVQIKVPLVRQRGDKDCGVAALAAILSYWGQPVTQTEIRRATGVPARQAIAASKLQEYVSSRGYESFLIVGTVADLRREMTTGRPVLVGMLKPYTGERWLAHYEVVTGISLQHVYTMNPAGSLERYPIDGFQQEWAGAKHLTLLIAPRASRAVQTSASTPVRNHGWQ